MADVSKAGGVRASALANSEAFGRGRLNDLRRRVSVGDGAPLTASDLAHLCHVETRVVHAWVAKGIIRSFRTPGQHLRFQVADVAAFLKRQGSADSCAETLVLCEATRRRLLKRRLARTDAQWFTEPLALLVAVGRSQPSRVVIDPVALGPLDPPTFIRVLTSALPQLQVLWLGKLPNSRLISEHVACVDEQQLC